MKNLLTSLLNRNPMSFEEGENLLNKYGLKLHSFPLPDKNRDGSLKEDYYRRFSNLEITPEGDGVKIKGTYVTQYCLDHKDCAGQNQPGKKEKYRFNFRVKPNVALATA